MTERLAIRKKSELIKLAHYRFNLEINKMQASENTRMSCFQFSTWNTFFFFPQMFCVWGQKINTSASQNWYKNIWGWSTKLKSFQEGFVSWKTLKGSIGLLLMQNETILLRVQAHNWITAGLAGLRALRKSSLHCGCLLLSRGKGTVVYCWNRITSSHIFSRVLRCQSMQTFRGVADTV